MTLLARYLIKNNIALLLLLCIVITALYCIFNFIDNKSVMSLAPSFWTVIQYYLLTIPSIISLLFSLLFFLSVVIQCTIMIKNKEILALLSSGIALTKILVIFFWYSLALVLISFIMTEASIIAEKSAREIYRHEIRHRPKVPPTFTNIWFKKDMNIININSFTPFTKQAQGITLYVYNAEMETIEELITAAHGRLENNTLFLSHVKRVGFEQSEIIRQEHMDIPFTMDIRAIEVANTPITELTFIDILQTITNLQYNGFDVSTLYSGLHSRITNSLSLLIMGTLALLIGLHISNSYIAIGVSILTAVIFFLSRQLLESLARLKIVSPSLAPWILLLLWTIICISIGYKVIRSR